MTKLKNIFNDILNGWSGLFMAIYGVVAFVLGGYAAIINHFYEDLPLSNFFSYWITISIFTFGGISILSPMVLVFSQATKKIQLFVGLPILIAFFYILVKYGKDFLIIDAEGGGIYFILYLFWGLPFAIILFIIPMLILTILDCKHKITPPKDVFKNNWIKLFFITYTLGCNLFIVFMMS